nr:hypothetical protein [uncultured Chitinophaga sp.]
MKRFLLLYTLVIIMSLSACISSYYPLWDEHSGTTNAQVEGRWLTSEGAVTIDLFTKSDLYNDWKNYQMMSEKEMQQTYFVQLVRKTDTTRLFAKMIKLDNRLYMDLTPMDASFQSFHTYLIGKIVELDNDKLSIVFANGAFIQQQLDAGRLRIAHVPDALFGNTLITASSAELQRFVTKYANDRRLFDANHLFTLKR